MPVPTQTPPQAPATALACAAGAAPPEAVGDSVLHGRETRPAAATSKLAKLRVPLTVTAKRTRLWGEIAVVVWLAWVYDAISNLAPLRLHAALLHAQSILHLERALHLDPELTLNRWLSSHHTLGLIASDYYDNAHFVVTLGLLGWLWLVRPDVYRPLRNTLVAINAIGLLVFWLYPVAPPRMLGGFQDIVASTHAFGSWHTGSLASAANQLAAMPSLHIAWATWCGLVVWRCSRRRALRTIALAYPCLTAVAVLATGNHFLLDVVAGAMTAALAAALVSTAELRRAGRPHWRVAHVTNLLRSL